MPSERVQRRIDRLLDQADEAAETLDWPRVDEIARSVLNIDPENEDALAFLGLAEPHLGGGAKVASGDTGSGSAGTGIEVEPPAELLPLPTAGEGRGDGYQAPTSFAGGRYEVSRFLGEGGKKRVYQARDSLLDREVAFALIKTEGFDQASRERISREAQAMGRLGVHPNIVAVLDLGQEPDGSPYMVTELMGGGDVEGLLASRPTSHPPPSQGGGIDESSPWEGEGLGVGRNTLSFERVISIAKAVCEGLEFAHSRGIVHRDLKPGNVWLAEDGTAKIGDFGLAVLTDRSRLTREGMMVGTVAYMPPEQATGGDITPRADLYSLGAMLYEMVTGRPPFLGDDDIAIIGQHINTPPVAPAWHNGDCPRPLEALIMRLLSKDPAERPESAGDVVNALDAIDLSARGESVEQDQTSLESLAGGVFVGRQAEMGQLKGALEDVLGGRGRLVTLVGEPGIGKTRTSEELATYAGLRGAQVLWGRCYETGGQPPYWPWVQSIRSYVRDSDADDLRRQMGSSASIVAEIVTDVGDRLPGLQPPTRLDDPEAARFRLFDAISSFLKAASQDRPIVMVLDDLHWSDGPSLALLEFMARELSQARVLLVCTYRDMELNRRHPLTVTLGALARERLYERVVLRGLTETDASRFIEIVAGVNPPAELSDTVHRHTEGNPLFLTEVVRELVQSGEFAENLSAGDSAWSIRIPEGVREVIGRRMDRLSERANDTLTTAALVGRDFHLDVLKGLAEDTTESQILDVLDEALDARIIEELPDEVGHYQFTHALMQETLTSELSLTRQVRSHARIAAALEELYGDRSEAHAAQLAYHYGEAEAVVGSEKLVLYSALAGRQALESTAYEAAVNHLQNAANAVDGEDVTSDTAEIYRMLGHARVALNEEREAANALTKVFDFYVDSGDVKAALDLAAYPHNVTMLEHVEPLVRRAVELAEPGSPERGRLLIPMTYLEFSVDRREEAFSVASEAVAEARRQNDRVQEARALAMQANIAGFDLRWDLTHQAALGALQIVETYPDPETEMRARLWQSTSLLARGQHRDGAVAAKEFIDAAMGLGHRIWIGRSLGPIVTIHCLRGEWDEALQIGEAATRIEPEMAGAVIVAVGLWTGDSDLTRSGWESMGRTMIHPFSQLPVLSPLELADQSDDVVDEIKAVISRWSGGVGQRRGDPQRVTNLMRRSVISGDQHLIREIYEVVLGAADPAGATGNDLTSLVLAIASRSIGELEEALGHFRHAIKVARDAGYRAALARSLEGTAGVMRDQGEMDGVEELEEEALALAQELGMRPLTERILARREILRA